MTPITDALSKGGQHEQNIRKMFPNSFIWNGETPLFPKPLFILAFSNRSGSNLLADYLRQTGRFRGFGESLNWDQVKRSHDDRPVAGFSDYILRLAGSHNEPRHWGVKASWDQIIMLQRARITSMFTGVKIIHSLRHDILGQAVSHWIAHQTNQWTSAHKAKSDSVDFSLGSVEQIIMDIIRSNAYIQQVTEAFNMPRAIVTYENLQSDPTTEIRRLAAALSVDLGEWIPNAPKIAQQRNERNDDFRERCHDAWRAATMLYGR